MHKDELIQLHTLLVQLKSHFEVGVVTDGDHFPEYKRVGVSPIHVHKSKSEHKKAIFVLGKELASKIAQDEFSGPGKMSNRLAGFVSRIDGTPQRIKIESH